MQNESIWVVGANGKLGSSIVKALKKKTSYKVIGTGHGDVDITELKDVMGAADIYRPTIIINCAAISDDAYCEAHEIEAYRVNTLGARNLAVASNQHNAKIIHISTDNVFSGENNRSKNEFDFPTPNTVFGKSKLAGEKFVQELNPKHLIIRSSWVYGAGHDDFCSYVLEKGKAGESFEVPVDRVSSPTSIRELVRFILVAINSKEYGIYHASCEGACTRHQFASTILSFAGYDPTLAVASFSKEDGAVVSTLLENLMMKMTGIHEMADWKDALKVYIDRHYNK